MERINLGEIVQKAITKFNQNRIAERPAMAVAFSPLQAEISWPDLKLNEIVKLFVHERLLSQTMWTHEPKFQCLGKQSSKIWSNSSELIPLTDPCQNFRTRSEIRRKLH